MSRDTLLVAAAAVAYFLYQRQQQAAMTPLFTACRYPDNTIIQVPVGNACPFDVTHGGQSYPCQTQIGPLQPGSMYC
jgi:hypothetical protein